jgi:hypothetical protein
MKYEQNRLNLSLTLSFIQLSDEHTEGCWTIQINITITSMEGFKKMIFMEIGIENDSNWF